MNVCPSCGTSNPDSAKFCLECGTRLTPIQPVEPAPESSAPETPNGEATGDSQPAIETEITTEPPRPKKDVSGLPPSWMPAPVTLSSRPSGQRPTPASPPPTPPVTTTLPPAPIAAEPGTTEEPPGTGEATTDKDVSGLPPSWMPPPVDLGAPRPFERTGVDDDWKMSDAGPLPDRKDRRLWLWIPVGLIAVVLVCCIAFFIWATTIGEDTVDGWATNAAVNQTEESVSGD